MSSGARATCAKCGQPLSFVWRAGKYGVMKWFPANPDGSDHWDLCAQVRRRGMGMVRADGSVDFGKVHAKHPPARSRSRATHVYCGTVPPWDESLGEFRDFTAAEKTAATVCNNV